MTNRHVPFLYSFLYFLSSVYCGIRFRSFQESITCEQWKGISEGDLILPLSAQNACQLVMLIQGASEKSKTLFSPHEISEKKFIQLMGKPYYYAVGYFRSNILLGYAYIHLYFPGKAFAGYFVVDKYQNQGIGKNLFGILRDVTGNASIPLYTQVHEDNLASLRISDSFTVEHKLPGGYLLLKHSKSPDTENAKS